VSDRLSVLAQYVLPKRLLTRLMGWLAGLNGGRATTAVIRWFVRRYGVNMAEAANPDVAAYPTFNEFFTRPLRDDARKWSAADFACPVDGVTSQCGVIAGDRVFQAKGHDYSTLALLGGDRALASSFDDGSFATLYLSPRDYHRIHMPCDGSLRRMIHVPGDLFSVNPLTARAVPGLFARNERVVCIFEGEHGHFAMVLVGATIVGSMATVWHGVVNPPRPGKLREWSYPDGEVCLGKGEEMGRFLLGSTVVLLFPRDMLVFVNDWVEGCQVRLGEAMGYTVPTSLQGG
jgi:phosphatidylserine decarboxylase